MRQNNGCAMVPLVCVGRSAFKQAYLEGAELYVRTYVATFSGLRCGTISFPLAGHLGSIRMPVNADWLHVY